VEEDHPCRALGVVEERRPCLALEAAEEDRPCQALGVEEEVRQASLRAGQCPYPVAMVVHRRVMVGWGFAETPAQLALEGPAV